VSEIKSSDRMSMPQQWLKFMIDWRHQRQERRRIYIPSFVVLEAHIMLNRSSQHLIKKYRKIYHNFCAMLVCVLETNCEYLLIVSLRKISRLN